MKRHFPVALLLAAAYLLVACGSRPAQAPRIPALTKAYIGAKTLPLRKEISVHSEVAATGNFGDKVDILRRQRMMMLVRLPNEQSGWVDARMLIRAQEMEALDQLAKDYKSTASMGAARAYDVLNVHTSPSRGSPSLDQIKDEETVDVLGHRVSLKAPYQPTVMPPGALRKKKRKGKGDLPDLDEPPPPKPPPPPAGWVTLSHPQEEVEETPEQRRKTKRGPVKNAFLLKAEQDSKKASMGPVYDDWSLVRTKSGRVGWVVSSALVMNMPEEVLQYAQRQRITSFFKLGEVQDAEKGAKGIWFWTTSAKRGQPFQFDAMRLFTFNTKRHRYETIFQQKDQIGYFPVEVSGISEGKPQISVIVEDGSGQCWRRRFRFEAGRLRLLDQVRVQKPRQPQAPEDLPITSIPEPAEDEEQTWWGKTLKGLFGK